jgi:hypothetical protein
VREGSERDQAFDNVLSQPEFPVASDKLCREKLKERMVLGRSSTWVLDI